MCKENLETLILTLTDRLFHLYNHKAFPHPETAPAKELLNCIRILTRVLPFIYEQHADSREADEWVERLFWSTKQVRTSAAGPPTDNNPEDDSEAAHANTKPLGEQLVDTAMGLLFCGGFTVPRAPGVADKNVLLIWETGVGCTTPITSTHDLESNKVEVLRFLLTLCSDCLYTSSAVLPAKGSRFLTYMTINTDRRMAMATLCSLLNTTLKYSPGWKVPYDHMIISDRHRQLITYSLQYLLVLLVYPVPESVTAEKQQARNIFRYLCGKIHKTEDLQFIADSLAKMLSQPIHANFTYLPGSRLEISWIPELTILFWDLIQCNRKFKAYLIASERMHDFMIILLYYIHEKRMDPSKFGLVRLCAYALLYLTTERSFVALLSKGFISQSSLPNNIQLSSFNGSYADYLIIQLFKTITTSNENMNFLVPTFLNCIYNISPFVQNISYQAASSIIQLCATVSNPAFLFAREDNHHLLSTLLTSVNLMVECNFHSNKNLVFLIMKNERVFIAIHSLTLEDDIDHLISSSSQNPDFKVAAADATSSSEADHFVIDDDASDEEEPVDDTSIETQEAQKFPELSALTAKSRKGKGVSTSSQDRPALSHNVSKSSAAAGFTPSKSWTSSWLPMLPTHTICSVINYMNSVVPYFQNSDNDGQARRSLESRLTEPSIVIDFIATIKSVPGVIFHDTKLESSLPPDFELVRFTWSSDSLGWYESILWGSIFQAEREAIMADTANVLHSSSHHPVGVWNGTNIKLFRLQETAPKGPSLLRPKGAVDALAESMLQKIEGNLNNFFFDNSSNGSGNNSSASQQ